MGIVDPTIVHRLKELQKDQAAQHEQLMAAVDQMNKGLAYIASLLERQASLAGSVYPASAYTQTGSR